MALVLVLGFLVLISALILAFFGSVQTELQSSKSYESSTVVKQLVTTATNIVTGQIIDGTKSTKIPSSTSAAIAPGDRLDWASQPGMIRTWDDSGKGWKLFKLYSSPDMVANFDANNTFAFVNQQTRKNREIPDDWPTKPGTFVDLNEPVLVPDADGLISLKTGGTYHASYPILDPGALRDAVEGFAINDPIGFGGTSPKVAESYNPVAQTDPSKTPNPAPMPVSWIYVLKDGTLTCPNAFGGDNRTAVWSSELPKAAIPTKDNPIVGRLAFWTDDESCKLNINTSSEPTPWDTPRAVCIQDLNYGKFQPAQYEYQRYAGHPYMTALSPVFYPNTLSLSTAQKEALYTLLPRVEPGGSIGGTVAVNLLAKTVTPDRDRLFANVDELLFEPNRHDFVGDTKLSALKFDTDRLRRARFFLTANSRAPEINLYGKPRISMWPESSTTANRTPFDQLAAFCTTLGSTSSSIPGSLPQSFYFQRQDSTSPSVDWNLVDPRIGTKRNQDLYKYLQNLTAANIPGFGGNFLSKWSNDRDQVLTEIFDYIRSTNLDDPTVPAGKQYAMNGTEKNGQVAPIVINNTKGFGRFHTVSQVGIHFICSQDGVSGLSTIDNTQPKLQPGQRALEAAILLEPYSPSEGWYQLEENMFFDVTCTPMFVDGQALNIPQHATAGMHDAVGNGWHCNGRERGGAGGLRGPVHAAFGGANYFLKTDTSKPRPVVLANSKPTMIFSGGQITIKIYSGGSADPSKLIQTLNVTIPQGNFPIPNLVTTGTDIYRGLSSTTDASFWWTLAKRYDSSGQVPHAPGPEYLKTDRRWVNSGGNPGFKQGGLFRQEDVVRSVVPIHGDIRLIAGLQNVPDSLFVPVRTDYWSSPTYHFLHIFSEAVGTHTLFGNCNEPYRAGDLPADPAAGVPFSQPGDQLHHSSSVQYHYSRLPEIRPGAGGIYNAYGDFDNGVAQSTDGAFINKPDEGNIATTSANYYYFAWDFSDDPTATNFANFFSPNRLIPSPGMLGSLPIGVLRGATNPKMAWTTLLFRPQKGHPGAGTPTSVSPSQAYTSPPYSIPPDHLLMDLFWMPVCEPYAISEPFSTSGKINLNYEIAPFTYIRRTTALHGVMKSEQPLWIPNTISRFYKLWDHETNDYSHLPNDSSDQDTVVKTGWDTLFNGRSPYDQLRGPIDVETTLGLPNQSQPSQVQQRFENGEIFRSASQICELFLPRLDAKTGKSKETLAQYLAGSIQGVSLITGDNTRERPYTNLYGRVTTRSNTFTVHMRVQALHQVGGPKASDWASWREGHDQKLSEYRGSNTVERYIDPADPSLPNFTTDTNAVVDNAYRIRVISSKKFAP